MLPLFIMAIENDTDRQFVAGLYQRHRDFLLRCAQKILNDPDRAEEALHEAMLRVIRSLERVRQIPAEELLPYLVTIVQTASIDLYHKTNRERQAAQGRDGQAYVLEFETAGGSHRLHYPKAAKGKGFADGETVTLYYDPEDPEKMYVEGDRAVLGAEVLYFALAVVLVLLMAGFVR